MAGPIRGGGRGIGPGLGLSGNRVEKVGKRGNKYGKREKEGNKG